jgi:hypothetical protein
VDLVQLIEEYRDYKGMHCMEGSSGVENLCKMVRALGYRDSMNRMQFRDGCLGDLVEFLEDNSGAIEAIVAWIGERNVPEWKDNLESELPARKVKDFYPDCLCPDCQDDIPDDAVEGEECLNCGHVFVYDHEDA